jgi:hypothetical protein
MVTPNLPVPVEAAIPVPVAPPPAPVVTPVPVVVDSKDVEWAKHLFDEWKYRHDAFWKTLYRALSAIAVLVAIPFVKVDFLKPVRDKNISIGRLQLSPRTAYAFLPLIIFGALCFLLASEYGRQRQVERELAAGRGSHNPELRQITWEAFRKRTFLSSALFIVVGFALWLLWFQVLQNLGAENLGAGSFVDSLF